MSPEQELAIYAQLRAKAALALGMLAGLYFVDPELARRALESIRDQGLREGGTPMVPLARAALSAGGEVLRELEAGR